MKYFTMDELTRTSHKIANEPGLQERRNLELLVEHVLDPLREAYGKPIRVTSGYRSKALNRAVCGSESSHHLRGMAADITGTPCTKAENKRLYDLVVGMGLRFTQLIDEYDYSWVHVSYDVNDLRMQELKIR